MARVADLRGRSKGNRLIQDRGRAVVFPAGTTARELISFQSNRDPGADPRGLWAKARMFKTDLRDKVGQSGAEFAFDSLMADIERIGNVASTV